MSEPIVADQSIPSANNPVGATASVTNNRDLKNEKDAEAQRDKQEAAQKQVRFQARKITSINAPSSSGPEYETLIHKAAVNRPLADLSDLSPSGFIPNFTVSFYILNYMDNLMMMTKRWTDNCSGWAPPISQLYISVLLYIQIFRAMDAAGHIAPGSLIYDLLKDFVDNFPLNELWIPGPLVSLFRNLSAFWPTTDDQFGNVTPYVPVSPGWTRALNFNFGRFNNNDNLSLYLPNPSIFISRLRSICSVAAQNGMDQATFSNHINGPNYLGSLFRNGTSGTPAEQMTLASPGVSFAYPDNLIVWKNAQNALSRLSIPNDWNNGTNGTAPSNTWGQFLRLSSNEYHWFGPVAALMAKYCQYFNGSSNLDSVPPNCSATGAVKLRAHALWDLNQVPTYHTSSGQGNSDSHGDTNNRAHYELRFSGRAVFNSRLALRGVPDANVYAAHTYALNLSTSQDTASAFREGPFWNLNPDAFTGSELELLPGILPTIVREYHSDVRITASKQ